MIYRIPPRRRAAALSIVATFSAALGAQMAASGSASAASTFHNIRTVDRSDGDTVTVHPASGGLLQLQVLSPGIVRVLHERSAAFARHLSLMVDPNAHWARTPYTFKETTRAATLTTSQLTVNINVATGDVTFRNRAGDQTLLAEKPGGRFVQAATAPLLPGKTTPVFNARQEWLPNANESLYGLGQQQLGLLDIKGYDLDLWQHNGTIAIPFLTSSRGYGVLWDNSSYTRFGDPHDATPIPASDLLGDDGKPGGLTVAYFRGTDTQSLIATSTDAVLDVEPPAKPASGAASNPDALIPGISLPVGDGSVRWTGYLAAPKTGDYLLSAFSNGGIQLTVNGNKVMDHWRQAWLPWKDEARVHLTAGQRVPVKLEWTKDEGADTISLKWKLADPARTTSLWSQVADDGGIDYYFVYGPGLDNVIAGYRRITGAAPMMPQWAYGFWQSRDHYETQQQSLDVVNEYRARRIPFDVIVQDWQYWVKGTWGSHAFDKARFPKPTQWIKDIHAQHAHVMISVWPKFDVGTHNFDALQSAGYLYQPSLREHMRDWIGDEGTFYDAFNPNARRLYWSQINEALFSKGIDAWWMDASEPDMVQPLPTLTGVQTHMSPTYYGPGARVLNGFPLENSKGIYEGQRSSAPNQRVFLLTRSAFAGQQRYAGAVWSGDSTSTWTAMSKQIQAGLGYSLSGMPYWTMDVGGYEPPPWFTDSPSAADKDEWNELNARWFEFGTFAPLLRVHGQQLKREMWEFGGVGSPTYNAEVQSDQMRYRLLPYIYSVAAAVTRDGTTFMRPLVMDFPGDPTARETKDEYLFGPSILVSPITKYKARSRPVYLPNASGGWYDFLRGLQVAGGRTVVADAPADRIPLYVRAGSIIPSGPQIQYVGEKPGAPITLYVYAGANGGFKLYEDDGLTYNYTRGEYSMTPIAYDDRTRTLTIGTREGHFAGEALSRVFNVVRVAPQHTIGFAPTGAPRGTQVNYRGKAITVQL